MRIDIDSYGGVNPLGTGDSIAGIQQAIVDGEKGGATEYLIGPGVYRCLPQSAYSLIVRGSNLTFHARGRTILQFGAGPSGRSHGILLAGGPLASPQHDVALEGIEFDGAPGYDAAAGWDVKNKAFAQAGSGTAYYDRVTLRGCYLHHWCGEVIYGGGSSKTLGLTTIEDCEITDSNADGISTSAAQVIRRNTIRRCGYHGIEDTYDQGEQQIIDNDISDCGLDGIGTETINAVEPYGPSYIERNRVKNCKRAGIAGRGTRNVWVRKNTLTDCGYRSSGQGPLCFTNSGLWQGSTTRDLHVRDNDVVCDRQSLGRALILAPPITGTLDTEQPRVWRTSNAITNGLTVG